MKVRELTLDNPLYSVSFYSIQKYRINSIRRYGEKIAVLVTTGATYYCEPDATKVEGYFLTLEDAQEEQKLLRIKRLDDLRKQVENAVQEYAEAVNRYTFVEANSNTL